MSYILDALKKAKHERELGQIPNLQTAYATPALETTQTQHNKKGITRFIIIFNVILAIALVAIYIYQVILHSKTEKTHSVEIIEKTVIPNPAIVSEQLEKTIISNQTTMPKTLDVMPKPTVMVMPPASPLVKHADFLPPTPQPVITVSENTEKVKKIEPEKPKTDTLPKKTIPTTIPLLQTMPVDFQQKLPNLDINVHVYANHPEKRFVLINGKRYQEGMQINKAITLEKIRTSDIILQYKKQYFRLQRP